MNSLRKKYFINNKNKTFGFVLFYLQFLTFGIFKYSPKGGD